MFQIPRAVRRAALRPAGRVRRMPVLAAVTVTALVALSAQGAAVASADEVAEAAGATEVTQATDPTQATEASGPADAAGAPGAAGAADPTQATEASGPADAAGGPGGGPADPTQATEASGPADAAGAPGAAGSGDPTQATEAPGPSDAPGTGAPASGAPGASGAPAGATDPTQATEAPGPAGGPVSGTPADGLPGEPAALVNTPPVGVADHYMTTVGTVLKVTAPGVVGNDIDPDGDTLRPDSWGTTGSTGGGHVSVSWDGSLVYTPAAGFVGTDTWSYWVSDGTATSATSVPVTFTVVDTTDVAPVAQDDDYSTPAGTALVVSGSGVLANDTDSDGDPIAITSALASAGAIGSAKGGSVDWLTTGGFTYLPAPGFVGYDTVTYRVTDGVLEGNLGTVTIKVGDWANLPPVAADDHYATPVNRVLTVDAAHGLLANDSDATDPIAVLVPLILDTGRASVYLNSDGSFSYASHDTSTIGPDTFTYRVTDGTVNLPVTATVTIDVGPIANADPIAANDNYTTAKNTGLGVGGAVGLLANDSDPDGDTLVIQQAQPNAPTWAGGIVNVGEDGSFSYTPPAGFVGADAFSYTTVDVFGGTATGTATITVTDPDAVANTMPVATDDHYATTTDTVLVVTGANGMLTNDFDADGDPLSAIIPAIPYGSSTVAGGTVTGTPDGGFTYTPPAGFVGDDEFVYEVTDQGLESYDVGTVRITVTADDASVPAQPGTGQPGAPDAGAADGSDGASGGPASAGASGGLALTGAAPDVALAFSLLLLLAGAAGTVVAAMAHRRSRRS